MRIVRSGWWRYDNAVDLPVDVVALDFDFWYDLALADDMLDEGEQPTPLGPDSCLYYVRYARAGSLAYPTWVDSAGFASLEEAMAVAPARVPSPIRWESTTGVGWMSRTLRRMSRRLRWRS